MAKRSDTVCFVVRPPYRGQGVMRMLLDGAVEHARAHGAEVVEGYPVETGERGTKVEVTSGYVGTTRLFEQAGFERAGATTAHSGGRDRLHPRHTASAETRCLRRNDPFKRLVSARTCRLGDV